MLVTAADVEGRLQRTLTAQQRLIVEDISRGLQGGLEEWSGGTLVESRTILAECAWLRDGGALFLRYRPVVSILEVREDDGTVIPVADYTLKPWGFESYSLGVRGSSLWVDYAAGLLLGDPRRDQVRGILLRAICRETKKILLDMEGAASTGVEGLAITWEPAGLDERETNALKWMRRKARTVTTL